MKTKKTNEFILQTGRKHHSCGGDHDHHHHHHNEASNKGERLRHSPYPMISVDDAMKIILDQAYKMPIIDKRLTGIFNKFLIVLD